MHGSAEVTITTEPLDARRCRFVLDHAVAEATRTFGSGDEARGVPLAQAVLEVPGVCEVELAGHVVTVVQAGDVPWHRLEPQVRYAIETAMRPPAAAAASAAPLAPSDDQIYDFIDEVFATQINPAVAQHGGRVELVDVQAGVVVVRMMGGCQGCGMATVTLRQGIEAALRRALPDLAGIEDITDHASGTNPYFVAGSK